jgi:hypothetical protein
MSVRKAALIDGASKRITSGSNTGDCQLVTSNFMRVRRNDLLATTAALPKAGE